jgi:succinate-acetate transporter protein
MLALAYILTPNITGGAPNKGLQEAGGMFGLLAAFFAWYVALAGIADDSNRYVIFGPWRRGWC